jgi:hypothetical protein
MVCIAACWLLAAEGDRAAAVSARAGPLSSIATGHDAETTACLGCHPSAAGVLAGPMATRAAERAFAVRALGNEGAAFFATSCTGCHVTTCRDCHGATPHASGRPGDEACQRCHRGYFVGWDYAGRAPREDHERYRRGPMADGEHFLKMRPDVHREAGLGCADCHTMRSLHEGRASARGCRDCHESPAPTVPEHAIAAHLERMECVACHAAWAPQEYGTFLVRARTPRQHDSFAALPDQGPWKRSAVLRRQDPPPLGLDASGKVAPIRPQFILFATDAERGWENRMLAAEWKAFIPHTVRRGSVACGGCHDAPRRYLLEKDDDRLYLLDEDGLPLRSFWSRDGQRVVNGAFLPEETHARMNVKTPEYVREHLRQWQKILQAEGPPSKR